MKPESMHHGLRNACTTGPAYAVSYVFQAVTLTILVIGAGMMLFVILRTVKVAKKLKQDEA